jgi:FkbM family methyltransferase
MVFSMHKRKPIYFLLKPYEKVKGFAVLRKYFSNWSGFSLLRLGAVKEATIRPRKEMDLEWVRINAERELITVKFGGKEILFYFDSARQLDNTMTDIFEQFVEQQYSRLDVKGKVVVDVGANVGDASLYFFTRGAKKVYGYEPYPYSCRIARQNIKLNKADKIVEIKNEAVFGSRKGIIIDPKYKNMATSPLEEFERGQRINSVSLHDIIQRHKLNGALLKMDCEGSEYEIILNASTSDLRKFGQIIMEYHYGYEPLVEKLRSAGFTTEHTKPIFAARSETNGSGMRIGMIYAH